MLIKKGTGLPPRHPLHYSSKLYHSPNLHIIKGLFSVLIFFISGYLLIISNKNESSADEGSGLHFICILARSRVNQLLSYIGEWSPLPRGICESS